MRGASMSVPSTGVEEALRFRGDLRLIYLIKLEPATGRLLEARLVPMQSRRLRMVHASVADG